jgi:hypothetical protein
MQLKLEPLWIAASRTYVENRSHRTKDSSGRRLSLFSNNSVFVLPTNLCIRLTEPPSLAWPRIRRNSMAQILILQKGRRQAPLWGTQSVSVGSPASVASPRIISSREKKSKKKNERVRKENRGVNERKELARMRKKRVKENEGTWEKLN